MVLVCMLVNLKMFCFLLAQVTVVTSQPGRGVVHQLETGLKDFDLVSLRRLLVVQILGAGDWGQDSHPFEDAQTEGTDLQHLRRIKTQRHIDV